MSERLTITAEPRTVIGKKVKQLRRDGWIPAVIYGGDNVEHIQLENLSLRRTLRHAGSSDLINVELNGKPRTVLVREIQKHVTRGDLIHVDFLEVDMNVKVTTTAELVSIGESEPAKLGLGVTQLIMRSVEIECLPDALISEIVVDFSRIKKVSQHINVRDLELPKGVEVLTEPTLLVARFAPFRGTEEGEEDEEGEEIVEGIAEGEGEI